MQSLQSAQGAALDSERDGSRADCLLSHGVLACRYAEGHVCETDYARDVALRIISQAHDWVKNGVPWAIPSTSETLYPPTARAARGHVRSGDAVVHFCLLRICMANAPRKPVPRASLRIGLRMQPKPFTAPNASYSLHHS